MQSLEKILLFPSWIYSQPTSNRHSITFFASLDTVDEWSSLQFLMTLWHFPRYVTAWWLSKLLDSPKHRRQGSETLHAEDTFYVGDKCSTSSRIFSVGNPSTFKCGVTFFCFPFVCFWGFFRLFVWCGPFLKSLLNLLQYCFCFMFRFFGREERGILAPWPGIEPAPPALEGEVLTTGPPGKSLGWLLKMVKIHSK